MADLGVAVIEALRQSREVETPREGSPIWGPRMSEGFRFGELPGDAVRDGNPLEWVTRALVAFYFIEHDNQPSTAGEIHDWVKEMTPAQVEKAVSLAIVVGLP